MAKSSAHIKKKCTSIEHAEQVYFSEVITQAIEQAMGIYINDTFKPFEDCALGKVELAKRL